MKQKSTWFLIGMIMLGVVLRTPFTTIPTILTDISLSLGVPVSQLGALTSLPLIMFALFSSLTPLIASKVGLERLFSWALLAMTVGSLIRIFNLPLLYAGTLIIGLTIALLNVLIPSVIQANQPHRIGFYTAVYTTSMSISTAVVAALAVPLAKASSWQGVILVISAVCLLAFLLWLPTARTNHAMHEDQEKGQDKPLWKNTKVWVFTLFCGLQSLVFYTGMTWFPTMASQSGLTAEQGGLLASIYTLVGIPYSILIPNLVTRLHKKGRLILLALVCASGLLGVSLLLLPGHSFLYWLTVILLVGSSVACLFPYLLVSFSLKTSNPQETAQLSGFSQTGGYLLAAFGPTFFGTFREWTGSWTSGSLILLALTAVMTAAVLYIESQDKIF